MNSNQTIQETVISLIHGQGLPHLQPIDNPFVSVIPIHSFNDFLWAFLYISIFYYSTYFIVGGLLEATNPFPKN